MASEEIDLDDIENDIVNSMSADDRQTGAEYRAALKALQSLLEHVRVLRAERLEKLKPDASASFTDEPDPEDFDRCLNGFDDPPEDCVQDIQEQA